MARTTMADLINRTRALLGGDTQLSDDAIQSMLDSYSEVLDEPLVSVPPFYFTHNAPVGDWEDGAIVYSGVTPLDPSAYTFDTQRGIVQTQQADRRPLRIQGRTYDINAAAADGWQQIAARTGGMFDWSDVEGSYKPSQLRDYALSQAASFRARTRAVCHIVERGDTLPLDTGDWRGDVLNRARGE